MGPRPGRQTLARRPHAPRREAGIWNSRFPILRLTSSAPRGGGTSPGGSGIPSVPQAYPHGCAHVYYTPPSCEIASATHARANRICDITRSLLVEEEGLLTLGLAGHSLRVGPIVLELGALPLRRQPEGRGEAPGVLQEPAPVGRVAAEVVRRELAPVLRDAQQGAQRARPPSGGGGVAHEAPAPRGAEEPAVRGLLRAPFGDYVRFARSLADRAQLARLTCITKIVVWQQDVFLNQVSGATQRHRVSPLTLTGSSL